MGKLTALKVDRITTPGRYGDGFGLWLQVSPTRKPGKVTKSWLLRYSSNGRARQMGLGQVGRVTLAQAREKALTAYQLIAAGTDPIDAKIAQRQRSKIEAAGRMTFKQCAEKYIEANKSGWRNEKHRAQWSATLETYAFKIIGDISVAAVDTALVLKILEPLWVDKTETATRLRGRIERVLDWAKVRGYRDGDNPARWKGHLKETLPARSKVREVRHHPALPYADAPAFMADLRNRDSISARALEITALTALRTSEVIGARWPEFDLQEKIWTVPAERMKARKKHSVPSAIALLRS
jgi:integrase